MIAALKASADRQSGGIIYEESGKETRETLSELYQAAHQTLGKLQSLTSLNLAPGDYVLLQIRNRQNHFHVWWACVMGGIVPVTVAVPQNFNESNAILHKIRGIYSNLSKVKQTVILTEELLINDLTRSLPAETLLHAIDNFPSNVEYPLGRMAEISLDNVLFHQLTSGSTGIPKCIQETHGGVIAHITLSAKVCGYKENDVSLNWLPFDHVVPMLTTHLRDVYLGLWQVQVPTHEVISSPLLWLDLIEKHNVNFSWSPNFGFNMAARAAVSEGRALSWDLSSLKLLLNAGEQVTSSVCDAFIEATGISAIVMQPSFGMAEACTCMTYCDDYGGSDSHSVFIVDGSKTTGELRNLQGKDKTAEREKCSNLVQFVDLGPCMDGVEIRITDSTLVRSLPERHIGHFQIRGPVITPGYLNNPAANAEAFVGDEWFDSGDLGFIHNKRLFLTGRAKESICIRGANLFCYEIESIVERASGVMPTFVAVTSVPNTESGTEDLLIFYSPQQSELYPKTDDGHFLTVKNSALAKQRRAVLAHVASASGITPSAVIAVPSEMFHKTTSGKIQRLQFRSEWISGIYDAVVVFNNPDSNKEELKQVSTMSPALFGLDFQVITPDFSAIRDIDNPRVTACTWLIILPTSYFVVDVVRKLISRGDSVYYLGSCNSPWPEALPVDSTPSGLKELIDHALKIDGLLCAPGDDATCIDKLISLVLDVLKLTYTARLNCPFWVITENVFLSDSKLSETNLVTAPQTLIAQQMMHSLARQVEHMSGRVLDFDNTLSLGDGSEICLGVLNNIFGQSQEFYIDSNKVVHRPIMTKIEVPTCNSSFVFKSDRAYVVTGGMGGIGICLSKWLIEKGAKCLVLAGRREPTEFISEEINALRNMGENIQISIVLTDVSTREGCAVLLDKACVLHPIGGIFHLAGHYTTGDLGEDSAWASSNDYLLAKGHGATFLHELSSSSHPSTEYFVLFSSLASILPFPKLCPYALANAYLDGLCAVRERNGLPTTCINWGPWADMGMNKSAKPTNSDFPVQGFDSSEGFRMLECLLRGSGTDRIVQSQHRNVTYASIDVDKYASYFTGVEHSRWGNLLDKLPTSASASGIEEAVPDSARLCQETVWKSFQPLLNYEKVVAPIKVIGVGNDTNDLELKFSDIYYQNNSAGVSIAPPRSDGVSGFKKVVVVKCPTLDGVNVQLEHIKKLFENVLTLLEDATVVALIVIDDLDHGLCWQSLLSLWRCRSVDINDSLLGKRIALLGDGSDDFIDSAAMLLRYHETFDEEELRWTAGEKWCIPRLSDAPSLSAPLRSVENDLTSTVSYLLFCDEEADFLLSVLQWMSRRREKSRAVLVFKSEAAIPSSVSAFASLSPTIDISIIFSDIRDVVSLNTLLQGEDIQSVWWTGIFYLIDYGAPNTSSGGRWSTTSLMCDMNVWYIHNFMMKQQWGLEAFLFMRSSESVYGLRDSHLYVCGKAFLDSLAHLRQALNCCTISFQVSAYDYNAKVADGLYMSNSPETPSDSTYYSSALFSVLDAMRNVSCSEDRKQMSPVVMNQRSDLASSLLRIRHPWDSRLYESIVENFDNDKEIIQYDLYSEFTGVHSSALVHESVVVHPTANIGPFVIIDSGVVLGPRVCIGPYTYVQKNSLISSDCRIGSHCNIGMETYIDKGCVLVDHVTITNSTQLGRYNTLYSGVKIGLDGSQSSHKPYVSGNVCVKNYCVFREDVNVQSPYSLPRTLIGSCGYFMVNASISHDCYLGNHVILSSKVSCAGFTTLLDNCWVGMGSSIHQFAVVGAYAMLGMNSTVTKDIPPCCTFANGEIISLNETGLMRYSFSKDQVLDILTFYTSSGWLEKPFPHSPDEISLATDFVNFKAARALWAPRRRVYHLAFLQAKQSTGGMGMMDSTGASMILGSTVTSTVESISIMLVEVLCKVLSIDIAVADGIKEENFFEIGLDSMRIARFVFLINEMFHNNGNPVVQNSNVFEYSTITSLSEFIFNKMD